MRCGTCMAVCPVYRAMRHEGAVARGKLLLCRARADGEAEDRRELCRFLTACLLCNRCRSSCPNEVDTARVVQAARVDLARGGKLGRLKAFAFGRLLPSPRLPALLKGARFTRPLWAARVPGSSGLHIRLLRGPRGTPRLVPQLARPFYLERPPPAPLRGGPRVALFVGCFANYLKPSVAEAAATVLRQAGADVFAPRDQACCGLAAFGAGEVEAARRLARRNLDALWPSGAEPPDAVTSPCASCASMLRHHLPELLPDVERAQVLSARAVPFSRLWATLASVEAEGQGRLPRPGAVPITYHDPCHLSRGFSEKDAPRFLLSALPGAELREMSHPCSCCGHGGTFSVSHGDLAAAIGAEKASRIAETGARAVVTECSGCLLQLAELLEGTNVEVLSTAEAALRFARPAEIGVRCNGPADPPDVPSPGVDS